VHTFRGLRSGDVERLRRTKGLAVLEATPTQQVHYLGFKVTRPGVSDLTVRKAISTALNRDELARAVTRGLVPAAKGIFLPTMPDYWPGQEALFPRPDPARARALLDAAGWRPGPDGIRVKEGQRLRLTLLGMLGTVEEHEELHPLIQAQLREVGVDVEVKLLAVPAFFATLGKPDYDLWTLATPYESVLELLKFWYWSRNIPSPNRTLWNDPRTDEYLLAAETATSDEARAAALREVQRIAAENHLLLPLWHEVLRIPVRVEVKGFRPHALYAAGYYKLLDVWLDR
jgi:ABC-type transport system substrate-binding protein